MPKSRRGPTPAVSAAVLVVLTWWCEETDHTADGICNLLWSHNQLTLTNDPTQLRGLEAMMTTHAPKTPMEYTRDITSLFNSYCRDIDIESITEPRKKKQAERLCNERASNTIDTLFRIPPASWRPVHTHESTFRLPPLETWKDGHVLQHMQASQRAPRPTPLAHSGSVSYNAVGTGPTRGGRGVGIFWRWGGWVSYDSSASERSQADDTGIPATGRIKMIEQQA